VKRRGGWGDERKRETYPPPLRLECLGCCWLFLLQAGNVKGKRGEDEKLGYQEER